MTYNEETFVLRTLKELKEFIEGSEYKRLVKETHENNIMLRKLLAIEYKKINVMYMANKSSNKNGSSKRPRPVTRKAGTVGRGYGKGGKLCK